MVIEKVHGIQATSLSLNDRFSLLSSLSPPRIAMKPKRRLNMNSYFNPNLNNMNRNLLEQIARRLEQQAKRISTRNRRACMKRLMNVDEAKKIVYQQTLRHRLGTRGGLKRFGSESSLLGLRRSNSFGDLSQLSVKNRVGWRQSNGNLSRSASFNNLSNRIGGGRPQRGFRRWGGGQRPLRGRFRGGRRGVGVTQMAQRPQVARWGTANRGRGRGGVTRNQPTKPVLSKEELDIQLEQYMSGTKAALDRELDQYMKEAMDLE